MLHKETTKLKIDGVNLTYLGLIPQIKKSFLAKDVEAMQPHIRAFVERAVTFTTCPECDGTRLSELARSSKIDGKSIADVCAMQIIDLADWVGGIKEKSVAPLVASLRHTPIRKAFAKANDVKPALFSSNSEGVCPACNGAGVIYTELGVMATVESVCEDCEGKRLQSSVLQYLLGGKNIAEVLAMPVVDALTFFGEGDAATPAALKIVERLADVGLGCRR